MEGVIQSCEPKSLNLHLTSVTFYPRRVKGASSQNLDTFFVRGRFIRFVHFDGYKETMKTMRRVMPR